ncbi:glycosyltransferase [Lachnospiraceae bacterium JLR.KK008]
MKKNILIVTEANARVASGHLLECISCYHELRANGVAAELMINADMPSGLKARMPDTYYEYETDIQREAVRLVEVVREKNIDLILFNLREIANSFLQEIRRALEDTVTVIVIDEFGRRKLEADIIINPMIDSYYWEYDTAGKVYCGAQYLILPENLKSYHEKEKEIRDKVETITVSMGGVDAPGTTVKLAKWLGELSDEIQINLVLGGGFAYTEQLNQTVNGKRNIMVCQNISYLYDLFMQSDIAICAGGNTLHELAALGVPALVIPSMPHEQRNGQAFERQGFSLCCEEARQITKETLTAHLRQLSDSSVRRDMQECGKRIADGRGDERVCRILLKETRQWNG